MYLHANAKLGLAGRLALVRAIEDGMTLKAAAAARGRAAGADLRLPPPDGLGSSLGRRRDRLCPFDRLEGAAPARPLASATAGQGAGQQLRVAVSWRSAAHGRKPVRALPATGAPRHRRPLAALPPLDAPGDEGRIRLRARDRRRPLP